MKQMMSKLLIFVVAIVVSGNLAGWRPIIGDERICLHRPAAACEPFPPSM